MDDPIEWRVINEDRFNAVVETLLVRAFTDPSKNRQARAISGRGGDGGVDVGVWDTSTNELVEIFQLKHFPDGWPVRVKGRRTQITNSFEKAWSTHRPPKWTLVTPSNPSMNELQFVKGLGKGKRVTIDVMGPAELDGLLGDNTAVLERFGVDRGRQLLRDIGREEFALNRPGDVPKVFGKLHEQMSKQSDHWGQLVTLDERGNVTREFRALTPNAAEREPLEVNFTAQFSDETRLMREAFEDGLKHGVTEPIELDATVLRGVKFEGPDWFADEFEGGELTLLPVDNGEGRKAGIVAKSSSGQRVGRLDGAVKTIAHGSDSIRVVVESPGGLETRWTLPRDFEAMGKIDFTSDFTGHKMRDIRKLIRFLRAAPEAGRFVLEIDGETVCGADYSGHAFEENAALVSLIDDLLYLEDELDVEFVMPAEALDVEDRLWARILRRIIQGVAVPYPGIDGFNLTLNGERGMEDRLEQERAAVLLQQPDFALTLLGTEVFIGTTFIVQSRATFVDGAAHAAAIREGKGEGRSLSVRATDNLPFVIYAPDRLVDREVVITGWGVDGIQEHPGLEAARQNQRERRSQLPGREQSRSE